MLKLYVTIKNKYTVTNMKITDWLYKYYPICYHTDIFVIFYCLQALTYELFGIVYLWPDINNICDGIINVVTTFFHKDSNQF